MYEVFTGMEVRVKEVHLKSFQGGAFDVNFYENAIRQGVEAYEQERHGYKQDSKEIEWRKKKADMLFGEPFPSEGLYLVQVVGGPAHNKVRVEFNVNTEKCPKPTFYFDYHNTRWMYEYVEEEDAGYYLFQPMKPGSDGFWCPSCNMIHFSREICPVQRHNDLMVEEAVIALVGTGKVIRYNPVTDKIVE